MSERHGPRGPADASQVNVLEAQDLKYWCRALGVSVERLVQAVAEVGLMADDVRAELRRQRKIGSKGDLLFPESARAPLPKLR